MKTNKFIIAFAVTILTAMSLSAGNKTNLNIVFIGNSITQGVLLHDAAKDAPPAKCAEWLRNNPEIPAVDFFNGGLSGCTTVDYLPGDKSGLFDRAVSAAESFDKDSGLLVFSIMLGTNDSACNGPTGAPVDAGTYNSNIRLIIDSIREKFPEAIFVVHHPVWYSANTYNGAMYLLAGQKRLHEYYLELQKIVALYSETHPNRVYLGDCKGYDHFQISHQLDMVAEDGNAGVFYLHPNERGAAIIGGLWGEAILDAVRQHNNK